MVDELYIEKGKQYGFRERAGAAVRKADRRTMVPTMRNAALTGCLFLLSSSGWLGWSHNLLALAAPGYYEMLTLVAGYGTQAAGTAVFALLVYRKHHISDRAVYAALISFLVCLMPSLFSSSLAAVLVFGLLLNLLCGFMGGCYLTALAESSRIMRGRAVGLGYGAAVIMTWLLSVAEGKLYYPYGIVCNCLLAALAACAAWRWQVDPEKQISGEEAGQQPQMAKLLLAAGFLVLLFSAVNSCGFSFPSADIKNGINVEFSRIFYAAGLVFAGVIADRSRKGEAVCAVTALIIPFVVMGLSSEPLPASILWYLSYFTFGFYTVFRLVLFTDLAEEKSLLYIAGAGLFSGRIGDAAGEALCLTLAGRLPVLICAAAVLFAASVFLFFRIYQTLYIPDGTVPAASAQTRTEETAVNGSEDRAFPDKAQEKGEVAFNLFSGEYKLSAREREVLRHLLSEKTNQEISETLFVSESTVKFHIHNLLQKTGCRNRIELLALYYSNSVKPRE